ncbi:hypothetical protein FOA52_013040 [Chlamydomonas sp. UWO 241]|nr:hypothetical protein FOA52_013040 [Chlamydomonas sp. UWO 241]
MASMLGSDLPAEIVNMLPSDSSGQLEMASRIVNYAFGLKVAELEHAASELRESLISKNQVVKTLERKCSSLEVEVQDMQAKNHSAMEDSRRLSSEKSLLIDTVKKLNREIAKLAAFKTNLLQTLHDDDEPSTQLDRSMAAVDLSSDRLVNELLSSASKAHTTTSYGVRAPASGPAFGTGATSRASGGFASGPSSPPVSKSVYTATPAARPDSPGSGAQIDGKQFFQVARSKLSYEQFSQFLHNIKELNAGRQNRDETLSRVRDIFGYQHHDLFAVFEQLLNKAATSFGA